MTDAATGLAAEWTPLEGVTVRWGDCIELAAAVPDESIDFCLTDPPYRIPIILQNRGEIYSNNFDSGHRGRKEGGTFSSALGYGDEGTRFIEYGDWFPHVFRMLKPGGNFVCWDSPKAVGHIIPALLEAGFEVHTTGVWHIPDRITFGANGRLFRSKHELIYWASKPDDEGNHYETDQKAPFDVWTIPRRHIGDWGFAGVKPLEILRELIEFLTPEGGLVLDMFTGTGSILRAAWDMDRTALGFELVRDRQEIIARRLQAGQGKLDDWF